MVDRLTEAWPGLQVERVAETGSTNSDLLERARTVGDAAFPPTLLIAERQRAGRGRRGQAWHSSAGRSLTCSVALPMAASDWAGLSLAVGVALAEALDPSSAHAASIPAAARHRIGLKWPNDLWLVDADGRGRKLGGVLIESLPRAAGRVAVIGFGINVRPQAVDDASTGVASWQELDADASAEHATLRIVPVLRQALAAFERDGFGAFIERFGTRDVLRGHAVRTSAPEVEGTALGVNGRGALRVRTADGVREIESGEVSVRPVGVIGQGLESRAC